METVLIIMAIIAIVFLFSFAFWNIINIQEDVRFLKNKIDYLEITIKNIEIEKEIEIDYENLNQEL